jgi:hypothetical protein
MSRPAPPADRPRNRPACNEALKRRGALTIWSIPDPGGRAYRHARAAGILQRCSHPDLLTIKVRFGMVLRQTTGFVESLLRLTGLDWAAPDFSMLSLRQKTLTVNIPCRGSDGPLQLWSTAPGARARAKGSGADHKTIRGIVFPPDFPPDAPARRAGHRVRPALEPLAGLAL